LRLRWIQLDRDGFFRLINGEGVSKGLVILRDYLDKDVTLRNRGDGYAPFLAGARVLFRFDALSQLEHVVTFDKLDDNAGAVDGFPVLIGHLNGEGCHGRRRGQQGRQAQNRAEQ